MECQARPENPSSGSHRARLPKWRLVGAKLLPRPQEQEIAAGAKLTLGQLQLLLACSQFEAAAAAAAVDVTNPAAGGCRFRALDGGPNELLLSSSRPMAAGGAPGRL